MTDALAKTASAAYDAALEVIGAVEPGRRRDPAELATSAAR